VLDCEAVSADDGVPELEGEPSCDDDCVCVRLSVTTCEGVTVRVRPPETVCEGDTLGVTEDEGVDMPDDDADSLRLCVSLGEEEAERVADALPVGPWLLVCVMLGDIVWLRDCEALREDVCDGD